MKTAAATVAPAGASGFATRAIRQRFRAWWQARLPLTDSLQLSQRNIYILPTRAGLLFAATVITLLLASINYQLSLGYMLTFMLASSGLVSLHLTHNTLRGLTLHLKPMAAVFAGDPAVLDIVLASAGGARHGVGLRVESAASETLVWVDVPAGGQAAAQVSFMTDVRGRHTVPVLSIETRFPLGLFRAWSIWRPAAQVLVYPQPERPSAPLPPSIATPGGGSGRTRQAEGGEFEGIRGYRRGDALKMVVWKKAAKALESGGELVTRDMASSARRELWLDWQAAALTGTEPRLSRLAAWVITADRADVAYGLRLPGVEMPRNRGEAHRRECLEALALWV